MSIFHMEPMTGRPIEDVPGIGPQTAKALRERGIDKAETLLGIFLLLRKNKHIFTQLLKTTYQATTGGANNTWEAMNDWCNLFL